MVTVENSGNAALSFPVPGSGTNPSIAANFTLSSARTCPVVSAGASAGTLTAGQNCELAVSFVPTTTGGLTGSLTLTDNSLNSTGTQTIRLSGTGTGSTSQTISFGAIAAQSANTTLALVATATSGLPVSFSSLTPSVCTVSGTTATLAAAGTCTVRASQPGNSTYAAAIPVTQSFAVNLLSQTITFPAIPNQSINTAVPVALGATVDSGLSVSYTSLTTSVCTVSGSSATLATTGTCTIQANQPGDGAVYAAAASVTQSFTVTTANPLTGTGFGSVNVGSTSAAAPVTVTMSVAGTAGQLSVVTQGATGLDFAAAAGGTCATGTSYNAGDSCTVEVTFAPRTAGSRYGAVVVVDGSGNLLGTSFLEGTGVGPQVSFLPGTEAAIPTTALSYPQGVAVDASGNVYIADTDNYRVLKEAPGAHSETVVTSTSYRTLSSLVVDGAGNTYVIDYGDGTLLKETPSESGYSQTTITTSAQSPSGVAVDGSGNIYIGDNNANLVFIEAPTAAGYTETIVPTSTLYNPAGLAVDGQGNVYIADSGNNRVLKETLTGGSYAESIIGASALSSPSGVAVDGQGNIYIADSGNNRVLKETLTGGSYLESTVGTSALNTPSGVAVDGQGNIYVADSGNNRILEEDYADAPALNFAPTAPSGISSDSPQVVTVENSGNAALSFPVPGSGTNPSIAANFALSSASSCPLVSAGASTAGTLTAGQNCTLAVSFLPTTTGAVTGSLTLTDNGASGMQSVQLSGTGTGSTSQTISFGSIAAQNANTTLGLVATATSGLPVSFSSMTPSVCTVSGTTATLAAGGTCTIQASQLGNSTYAAATHVTQSFAVNLLSQTITFPAIPNQVINTEVPVALGATANSGLPVSYTSLTTSVCAVSGSAATLVTAGTCTIQANQPGDGAAYAAAASVTQNFTVTTANPLTGTGFGSVNIGSMSAAAPVTVTMSAAGTAAQLSVVTEGVSGLDFAAATGGTCATGTSYNVGDSCTVEVTFAPRAAGSRYGAVVVVDGSGNVMGTSYVQGTGVGPQVSFLPGTEVAIPTTALSYPQGVAVDASGNVYIADTDNNRVLKESLSGRSYTEATITTSVQFPSAVAVDGAGDLYIADTANNRILKETPSGSSYAESILPTSTLSYPFGVAVDGDGNVYIADTGNDRILMEAPSAGGYNESLLPTSNLTGPNGGPFGVAADSGGNVYVSDTGNGQILKEILRNGAYSQITIPTSATGPYAIAVDTVGDLYVTNWDGPGSSSVLKETAVSGGYRETSVSTSALNEPLGVAIDGLGNVYIADANNGRILKEDMSDPPTLIFQPTVPGVASSDSPQTVTLENTGNSSLNLPIPASGVNPAIGQNFSIDSGASGACPSLTTSSSPAAVLAPEQSCQLLISFAPSDYGTFNGTLNLTDNALNASAPAFATQVINLVGISAGTTQQTITFSPISAQSVNSTVSLVATATSGLPVSFRSLIPAVCTVSGTTATMIAGGTCTLEADQSGSSTYATAPPVTQSMTVNPLAQTINFGPIATQSISSMVSLTATASSGLAVTFMSTDSSVCTVSGTVATPVTVGTCTIQASQSGNRLYAAAAPAYQSFTISITSGYERAITISHTQVPNTDQTSFPVLIAGTYPWLATVANSGRVLNPSGYDIVFSSDAAGQNLLPFEIDTYNGSTGQVAFWVRIPILSHTTDTTIYMLYGIPGISSSQENKAALWGSYGGVWHLGSKTGVSAVDSTIYENDGTVTGATSATGLIGGAANFNGSSQITIPVQPSLQVGAGTSSFSVSAWAKTATNSSQSVIFGGDQCGIGESWLLESFNNNASFSTFGPGSAGYLQSSTTIDDGNWHYYTGVHQGTNVYTYLDGALVNSSSVAGSYDSDTEALELAIGNSAPGGSCGGLNWNGLIDEVRFSRIDRSADWIATEYNNQSTPSNFYNVGQEQDFANPLPVINSIAPNPAAPGGSVTVSGSNFGSNGTVTLNGAALTASGWSDGSIVVALPSDASSGPLVVTVGEMASLPFALTIQTSPIIENLSPSSGVPGTSVTISGSNFGAVQGSSSVTFAGAVLTSVSWSDTAIVATVPDGAITGDFVVTAGGQTSNPATFTVVDAGCR